MPRARSPDSIKAEKLYHEGMKLVDIGKKLKVPASTVRRWKSTQGWDSERSENKTEKKTSARKRGGQPGNKNSAGKHKAYSLKPGDKLAEKHGAYSSVYWDTLDDEERNMLDDLPEDEEQMLIDQIYLFSVRERRIMKAINKYRDSAEPVVINNVFRNDRKRSFDNPDDKELYEQRIADKVAAGDRLPGNEYTMQTQTENKDNLIARLEKELSTVQAKKTKAIDSLAKLRLEKRKLEGESKGNEAVRIWAEKVKAMRGDN